MNLKIDQHAMLHGNDFSHKCVARKINVANRTLLNTNLVPVFVLLHKGERAWDPSWRNSNLKRLTWKNFTVSVNRHRHAFRAISYSECQHSDFIFRVRFKPTYFMAQSICIYCRALFCTLRVVRILVEDSIPAQDSVDWLWWGRPLDKDTAGAGVVILGNLR